MRAAAAPFFLPALLLAALILLPPAPAHALEKGMMEDMVVEKGETVSEVRTAMGDVRVEGEVEGDVSSGVGDIKVRGPVGGDVEAGVGDVWIDAPVRGDVDVGLGDLHLGDGARIGGSVSRGVGKIDRHPEAMVGGDEVAGVTFDEDFDEDSPLGAFSDWIGWGVMTLGLAAAAVLLAVAAPGPLRASARSLEGAPGRSLLLGVGSLPAMIVVSILLFFTVVGGLLIPLLWPAYLALVVFGALVAVYFLGRKVVLATGRYRAGDALAAVVGALLVSAAYQIPFLGGLVLAGLAFLGTGAAVLALLTRRRTRRPNYASYEEYLRARRDA
ncbi:MAG TPA: polymer-forming cytoskeletal protein [Rubrobacteraceae bacterium]|nr:polymer-forming cytoskeletal protein [Rubrobacteraceae bacterium]